MAAPVRSLPRWPRCACALVSALVIAGCGSHGRTAATAPVRIPLYAGMQGYRAVSRPEAASIARSVGLVVGTRRQLAVLAPAIERAHPGITIEVYVNAMLVHPDEASTYPAGWYLHDAAGGLVRTRAQGNVLMDPTSTAPYHGVRGWSQWVGRECRTALAAIPGAAGCFLDMIGPAPVRAPYNANGAVPVDPATGAPYTQAAYLRRTAALARLVERISGRPVIANGIESGLHWVHGTRALLAGAHGFEIEHWLGLNQVQAGTPSGWEANIGAVMELARRHRTTLVDVHTVPGQTSRSLEFALASFLLAAGPGQFLQIGGPGHSTPSWKLRPAVYSADLGEATRTAASVSGYRRGGLYVRPFRRGIVVVNPGSEPQPFHPPAGYTPAPGTPSVSGLIPPLTGVILTRGS